MRSVRSAICTSGDPVSVSLRRYFSTVAAFDGRFSAIVTAPSLTATLQNATPQFQLPATRPAPQPHHPPVAHPSATVFADSEQRKHRQFTHEPPVGVTCGQHAQQSNTRSKDCKIFWHLRADRRNLTKDFTIFQHIQEYGRYFDKDFTIILLERVGKSEGTCYQLFEEPFAASSTTSPKSALSAPRARAKPAASTRWVRRR